MVLDGVSALGLASSIIQIVDFSVKLFSKSKEYYKSEDGSPINQQSLANAARQFFDLSRQLGESLTIAERNNKQTNEQSALSIEEVELKSVASQCQDTAKELSRILEELRITEPNTRWRSFRHALKSYWRKEEIDSALRNMNMMREQMMVYLLVILNNRQDYDLGVLLSAGQSLERNILKGVNASGDSLKEEVAALAMKLTVNAEHTRTELIQQWQTSHHQLLDQLLGGLSEERTKQSKYHFSQRMLQSLFFVQMDDRYKRVREAHYATLNWIFDEPQHADWSSFVNWLESNSVESGIYWVSGKAGSGKSTLMRFLCDDARTRLHLDTWSGNKQLLIAKCFFWNAGTDVQKSLGGLLRSLLYQLLLQHSETIHHIFPHRWRAYDLDTGDLGPWTETEMLTGLRNLVQAVQDKVNIFILIDGLDEFDGKDDQMYEVVELLKEISRSATFKLCLSSRPWQIFVDAFEKYPRLRLENLTRQDISNYVQASLISDSKYRQFEKHRFDQCLKLKSEIVDKAQGVFLWVFLVVRAILHGIRDGDTLEEISEAVQGFPSDLVKFFSHMLGQLEDKHRADATKLFKIVLEEANIRSQRVTLLTISFASERAHDFALALPMCSEDEDQIEQRLTMARRRLNSRCKGLLEVHESATEQSILRSLEVDFLHRTVRDFLKTKEMQEMLEKYNDTLQASSLFLCNSYLAQLKIMDSHGHMPLRNAGDLRFLMSSFLANARCLEIVTGRPPTTLIDELGRVLDSHAANASGIGSWADSDELQEWRAYSIPILMAAIQHRLYLYAINKINLQPSLVHASGERPVLDLALDADDECPDLRLVQTILDNGGDPLAVLYDDTVWARFISRLARPFRVQSPDWFEITKLLVQKGVPAEIELSTLHHHVFTESRLQSVMNFAKAGNRRYVVKVRERLALAFGEQAAAVLEPSLLLACTTQANTSVPEPVPPTPPKCSLRVVSGFEF